MIGEEGNKEVNETGNKVEADKDPNLEEVRACASSYHHLSPETQSASPVFGAVRITWPKVGSFPPRSNPLLF
jgi:hypothetical protein